MKLFLLGNVIQTLNTYLLLQGEGSSGRLKHSWDGSAARVTDAPPCHGIQLGWHAGMEGGAQPSWKTPQLLPQRLRLSLTTGHGNSAKCGCVSPLLFLSPAFPL